jgi:hypothetical protein
LLLVVALAVPALAAHAAPDAPARERASCPSSGTVQTRGGPLKLTPLDQLPPGVVVLTVLRSVDGCSVMVVKAGGATYYVPGGAARRERLPAGPARPPR